VEKSKELGCQISKSQISRWERGKQNENVREHSRKALCRTLGVPWEELTREPKDEDSYSDAKRVAWRGSVKRSSRTVLLYVQARYGLSEEDIIDLAPLAFLILAERSLQARQTTLDEIMQAIGAVNDDANRRLPYLKNPFLGEAFFVHSDPERIEEERELLRERRLCTSHVFIVDQSEWDYESPFADFLREELKELGLLQNPIVIRDPDGFSDLPDCTITKDFLAQELGLDAADKSDRKILELIQNGRIEFSQASDKKKKSTEEGYRCWLAEQTKAIREEEHRRNVAIFEIEDEK